MSSNPIGDAQFAAAREENRKARESLKQLAADKNAQRDPWADRSTENAEQARRSWRKGAE
jgi:hypothetical protein